MTQVNYTANDAAHDTPEAVSAPSFLGADHTGSTVHAGSTGSNERGTEPADHGLGDTLHQWFGRYIRTVTDGDLDLLTLWTLHTWVIESLGTTPRLLIDSPVPESGKTTVIEHLTHLAKDPMQAASIDSAALLPRLLAQKVRTVLIDEADRSLDPKRPSAPPLLAVINAGYKRGAVRPVLVPGKEGKWEAAELPTFAPVAMAGNAPDLPDDTRSRLVTLLLIPDTDDTVEESIWEDIEPAAADLRQWIESWAESAVETVRGPRPSLPDGVKGRSRERWTPLKRVAVALGGDWPARCDALARAELIQREADREDAVRTEPPHMRLLRDIVAVWPEDVSFMPTADLIPLLIQHSPASWSQDSTYGKDLTSQRMGRMLASRFKINSQRHGNGPRGYDAGDVSAITNRMGIGPLNRTGRTGVNRRTGTGTCDACGGPMTLITQGQTTHPGCV